jgi:hypothetical protein
MSGTQKMSNSDLEVEVSSKIKDTLKAAIDKIGIVEFSKMTGISAESIHNILQSPSGEYVSVGLVTIACQINKTHGDETISHTSVAECLKGSTIRIPQTSQEYGRPAQGPLRPRPRPFRKKTVRPISLYDRRSTQLLGFSANLVTFLILGYFLGGIGLSILIGQPSCTGITFNPTTLSPCVGSLIGIVLGAVASLGYTVYYFVKKM